MTTYIWKALTSASKNIYYGRQIHLLLYTKNFYYNKLKKYLFNYLKISITASLKCLSQLFKLIIVGIWNRQLVVADI